MVKYILFLDRLRQEEIETFYHACQMQREYYKGYPKRYHPLTYFREPEYSYQCPPEMSQVYLSFPPFHVRYKQPPILPTTTGPTSGIPALPQRNLAARFNKAPCKAFIRCIELYFSSNNIILLDEEPFFCIPTYMGYTQEGRKPCLICHRYFDVVKAKTGRSKKLYE